MLLKTLNLPSIEYKTLQAKDTMLVTGIFPFSHDIFKRQFPQGHQKLSL
jgi:hypothetical protein